MIEKKSRVGAKATPQKTKKIVKKTFVHQKNKKNIKKKNKNINLIQWQEIWPQERDLLIRPERLQYVRKMIKDKKCVFCTSAKEPPQVSTLCLLQTPYSQIVLNKFPYNTGHLLVLPLRHVGEIWNLTEDEYDDLMYWLRLSMQIVSEVYRCDGINMGLNHGSVAGAGLPEHIHFHVIPRWRGDVNFFPLIAETKVLVESLEDSYAKLRDAFQVLFAQKQRR